MANKNFEKKSKRFLAILLAAGLAFSPISQSTAFATEVEETEGEAGQDTAQAEAAAAGSGVEEGGQAVENVEVSASEKKEAQKEAVFEKSPDSIKGHKKIAENDLVEMYLKEENLSLIIRNKANGAIMESTVSDPDDSLNTTWRSFIQSGVGFLILNGLNEERSDLLSADADIKVSVNADGFTADVTLKKYEISFRMTVALEGEGFTVEIPSESIKEEQKDVTIGSMYVYPFLGYTYASERDGYMLVPDGNGALIYLDDKDGRFSSPLTLKVWGDNAGVDESYVLSLFWDEYQTVNDSELVMAPVYGMVHTDTQMSMLAIIEEGAVDASIIAYPNGAVTNYNWVTPRFTMRRIYKQLTSQKGDSSVQLQEKNRSDYDIRIRYLFNSGEEADYAGMANQYREYLLEQDGMQSEDTDFRVRLDFLGNDRENGMIGKKTVTMTTTDDIREMYEDLESEQVTDILSVYKGWQKGGIWSVPITSCKADRSIGGTHDLTGLVEESTEKGIRFYLYQDALRANPDTVNTVFNVIKKLDESVYKENTYKEIYEYFNFQTPSKAIERLNSAVKSYEKSDVTNLALTGISDHLFSYNYSGKQYSRVDTLNAFKESISTIDEKMNLALESPLSCYWANTESILDMPVNSSNYIFTDEEVPFLSMALKGVIPMYGAYTNFEADSSRFFLELVETGIYPSFYLTKEDPVDLLYTNSSDLYTSRYEVYRPEIIRYYQELKAINDQVKGAYIIDRVRHDSNVAEVTYSNGVKIYVNYSQKAVTVDGVSIEGMSYEVR
ncbi:MAG: DUF5696 domain-containing protein [Lachnospiraceae bacterium]|nr:DUF5696 domain-containing protein [Lachnospiraceae bacterium]